MKNREVDTSWPITWLHLDKTQRKDVDNGIVRGQRKRTLIKCYYVPGTTQRALYPLPCFSPRSYCYPHLIADETEAR